LKPQHNRARDIGFYVLILVILLATVFTMTKPAAAKTYQYSEIYDLFKQEKVESFVIQGDNLVITLKSDDGAAAASSTATDTPKTVTYKLYSFSVFYEDFNAMVRDQYARGIISSYDYSQGWEAPWWLEFLPYLLVMVAFMALWYIMMNKAGGAGGVAKFSKARTKLGSEEKDRKTFADVAGCEEEKEELREIVEFLKKSPLLHRHGRPHTQGRAANRPSGHRQDAYRQGCGRRGGRTVSVHFRLRLCGALCRRGRVPRTRPF
jgi:cell division protease FtsH